MAQPNRVGYLSVLLLTQYQTLTILLAYCSPRLLCVLAKVDPHLRGAVHRFIARQWDLNAFLRRFVPRPLELREFMYLSGAVISGSQALQFLNGRSYAASDLDIYVPLYWAADLLALMIVQGYRLVSMNPPDTFPSQARIRPYGAKVDIHSLCTLINQAGMVLKLIVPKFSIITCILSFHSTCVMNWITWDQIFCLYPAATFRHIAAVVTIPSAAATIAAITKYRVRGFTMLERVNDDQVVPFDVGVRTIGDGQCWVVALDSTGIGRPTTKRRWSDVFGDGWVFNRERTGRFVHKFTRVNVTHSTPSPSAFDRRSNRSVPP